jgi:hypothetical protein
MALVLRQCNAQPAKLCAHTAAMVLHMDGKSFILHCEDIWREWRYSFKDS